jgi:hypothetical protein
MRYVTSLVLAGALGLAASLHTTEAKAGVVVSVGLPVVAAPVPYYPYYAPAPYFRVGVGPAFYSPRFVGPAFRGPGYFHPGYAFGGFAHGGYVHGGYFHRR